MACLSRLAVASVNTHRTRWPTPTPTQTRRVTYIYVLKCITHTTPLRTELPFSFRRLQPSPVSPATRLHGHRTSSLLSRRAGTYLPTAESEFCKSRPGNGGGGGRDALAALTIILKRKRAQNSTRIFIDRTCNVANCAYALEK